RAPSAAYPAINAASMTLLAGDRERARAIARSVRDQPVDDGSYWAMATMAEACLVLSDDHAARRFLERAEARAGDDFAARATTRRQLRLVAHAVGADPSLVEALRIPETIHYCGHMPAARWSDGEAVSTLTSRINRVLMDRDVGFVFGALAAGADIMFAEAALRRGAQLTVVLPFERDAFVRASVLPFGTDWLQRFDHCLSKARVLVVDPTHYPHDELDFGHGARRAMGLARMHARRLDGDIAQLAIWDGAGTAWEAGTAADVALWAASGGATVNLGCPWRQAGSAAGGDIAADTARRRWMGVLFGDLPRFGTLDDAALAAFYRGPLADMGRIVDRHAPAYRNAWGDAVQLAFASARDAAACALQLQQTVTTGTLTASGLPTTLVPRLALDFGPVLPVADAVQQVDKFAGRVMTRAARIEPVTPPGQIYATEAFACEVALDPRPTCACDYAGQVPTAKGFGVLPLYAVHPPRATPSEADAALRPSDATRPIEETRP
ncbi:MAG: hypothetical protein KIT36_24670, partial [Alphaproteobacteria bacterium]|nr:hypothetical protein [Alphaproteobacteria bacterium]